MKILVLTFYYKPDLSAGSFRTTALVEELQNILPDGSHIDVIATLPSRYSSFNSDAAEVEHTEGLSINRIKVPGHQSGMIDQSKIFITFLRSALQLVRGKEYDLVFATSSRLMTAVLGAWIAHCKGARLYLDIRDIFVDTIKDVLPRKVSFCLAPFFSLLEKWAVGRADKVNLVSAGFLPYFKGRYPGQQFSCLTNGIDKEFLTAAPDAGLFLRAGQGKCPLVLYAGNIGEGQGLHEIIPELARRMEGVLDFRIIGDGGRKKALESRLSELRIGGVEILPPVNRDALLQAYREADVLFLHLNDYEAFKKVLPSKVFEYAALGKPIWAGVSGYAAEFVAKEVTNAAIFHPCDVDGAIASFADLTLEDVPRNGFVAKFSRSAISRELAKDILKTAKDGR